MNSPGKGVDKEIEKVAVPYDAMHEENGAFVFVRAWHIALIIRGYGLGRSRIPLRC